MGVRLASGVKPAPVSWAGDSRRFKQVANRQPIGSTERFDDFGGEFVCAHLPTLPKQCQGKQVAKESFSYFSVDMLHRQNATKRRLAYCCGHLRTLVNSKMQQSAWLSDVMEDHRMTAQELAAKAGMATSTITRVLRGERIMGRRTLAAICDALGIQVPKFLDVGHRASAKSRGNPHSSSLIRHAAADIKPVLQNLELNFVPVMGRAVMGAEIIDLSVGTVSSIERPMFMRGTGLFALVAHTKLMEPAIRQGSTLIIDPSSVPRPGDLVAVISSDNKTAWIKELVSEDQRGATARNVADNASTHFKWAEISALHKIHTIILP